MKNCIKSTNMKNMFPIYIDIYDDLNKNNMCSNQ